ncbi:MAG TPA: hypothetical protein DCO75_01960 [Fibrobacteres bacterium]|jgi:hypothetical protein|nr:hypothetical protein [Fibrobacterota bacterium]
MPFDLKESMNRYYDERAVTRQKEAKQNRELNNGARFDIYKKYYAKDDILQLAKRESAKVTIPYFGRVFFTAALTW